MQKKAYIPLKVYTWFIPRAKKVYIFASIRNKEKGMAQRKNYRADNTYMISNDSTDNPKLGAKVLNDGRESLFLDSNDGEYVVTNVNGAPGRQGVQACQ